VRLLEVRRHARRVRPGQHLVQPGVAMARRLGKQLGPFDRVVSSPLPRCVETVVALGFAVDEDCPELAGADVRGETIPDGDLLDWDAGYAGIARLFRESAAFAAFANAQADLWQRIARSLPDGGRALVVGHGGFIEGAAVAAFPNVDHAAWGRTARHCEGTLVGVAEDAFVEIEILRVPKEIRRLGRLDA